MADEPTQSVTPSTPTGAVYTTAIALRWGDQDALAHVNNAVGVTLLEELRIRFFATQDPRTGHLPSVLLARTEVDYLVPLMYTLEPVTARLWVERIGTKSWTFAAEIQSADGPVAIRARHVMVAMSADGTTSVPIGDEARTLLARFLVPSS